MRIVLIGAGNLASHLGPLMQENGHSIIQLYNRSRKNGLQLSKKLKCPLITDVSELNTDADIYIISLRDEAIKLFLEKISFVPKLIVHTSGSTGIDVFPVKMQAVGVLYPLQTFSKKNKLTPENIPFCIEGNTKKNTSTIRKLAKSISKNVFYFNSDQRKKIHLAAVLVNNFTNHLFTIGKTILNKESIPFGILIPLIDETIFRLKSNNPEDVQTGPARRNDKKIISQHLRMLKKNPEFRQIYLAMSKSISRYYSVK